MEFKFVYRYRVAVSGGSILIESQWNLNNLEGDRTRMGQTILIESQWNLNAHRMLSDFHPTPDINRITVEFKFM